jgi:hypothetical protein
VAVMIVSALLAALINLNGDGRYIHWGFIQISVANFVVILLMIAVFVLAILLPFPRRKRGDQ